MIVDRGTASSGLTLFEIIPNVLNGIIAVFDKPRPICHEQGSNPELEDQSIHYFLSLLMMLTYGQVVLRDLRFKCSLGAHRR